MKKMVGSFMEGGGFAYWTEGRVGVITLVETGVGGAETANMLCCPKMKKMWSIMETIFNGGPVNRIKTKGGDGTFMMDKPVFHCLARHCVTKNRANIRGGFDAIDSNNNRLLRKIVRLMNMMMMKATKASFSNCIAVSL